MSTPPLDAIEIEGMTRSAFLMRGALGAGALYGTGAIAPFVSQALAAAGTSTDVNVLNFALTLERLEADFYKQGARLGLSAEAAKLVKKFGDQEAQHVEALTKAIEGLGAKPDAPSRFTFPAGDERSYLSLAETLEEGGVSAYNGAAPRINSKEILAAAGSIVQVEARHAALIRKLNGQAASMSSFDVALGQDETLDSVKSFIVG
jgi:rubrerythrin